MSNKTEEFGPPEEEVYKNLIIEEIDQQRAQKVWAKLQKEDSKHLRTTLRHNQCTFCYFKNPWNETEKQDFVIFTFPPNSDIKTDNPLAVITLVQEKNGFFTVILGGVDIAKQTEVAIREVNSILDKIATSVKETEKEVTETEDVISQTREKLK